MVMTAALDPAADAAALAAHQRAEDATTDGDRGAIVALFRR
jgi:hypothetical protein